MEANGIHLRNSIRNYLIKQSKNACSLCGWAKTNPYTKKVPLHIDHIDGDWSNNRPQNLRVLCPNCHALTSTYGSGNRGKGRPYYIVKKRVTQL